MSTDSALLKLKYYKDNLSLPSSEFVKLSWIQRHIITAIIIKALPRYYYKHEISWIVTYYMSGCVDKYTGKTERLELTSVDVSDGLIEYNIHTGFMLYNNRDKYWSLDEELKKRGLVK
jgi:phosphosulfolactate synthase (CoM biosynthesis protein A)